MRTDHQMKAAPSAVVRRYLETGLLSYSDEQLGALQGKLAGSVTLPGTPEYDGDRMVFMHTYQHYPQIIIHAAVYSDVLAALAFAKETGLKVTCRSGGHSTAGFSVNDQVVIDMSGIDHVLIDKKARTARVGAGANFRKLNMMLDMTGLHVPGGGCETVCVAGYMQGGGYGFTSRLFGLNCDSVTAVTVALPNGKIVRADDKTEKDLFWAIRGGTGNQFGVLLEIEYKLRALGELQAFGLKWMLETDEQIDQAVKAMQVWQAGYTNGDSPSKMGHQALMMYLPDPDGPQDPSVPGAKGQRPMFLVRGLYNGEWDECRRKLMPLFECMTDSAKQIDIKTRGRYLEVNELLLQTATEPHMDMPSVSMNTKPLVDSRIIADTIPEEGWRELVNLFLDAPDLTNFLAMEAYGGKINEVCATDMAYVHRDASFDLFTWAFWTFDKHEKAARKYLKRFGKVAGELSNGHRYQNYPLRGNEDFRREYFGENFDKLLKIKKKYDPENLFEYEQSITPEPK